jgi:predicted nucleic acid-binding protein
MSEDQVRRYVDLVSSLPIRADRRSWRETLALESLARQHHLAAYDVAYLELAKRRNLSLATTDQNLSSTLAIS